MKLTILPSGPGDCLLLEGADGKRVLIDGGEQYREAVAPKLGEFDKLDVVYVSHDDGDHIKGVLQLFEDMKAWIVFDHQEGNPNAEEPDGPRPPPVTEVWHNAFHDLLPDDFRPTMEAVETSLAIMTAIPEEQLGQHASGLAEDNETAATMEDVIANRAFFAHSQRQSHELSRLVGRNLLKVKVNNPAEGKILRTDEVESIKLGGMHFRILGPRAADIEKLHDIYSAWLDQNQDALDEIRRKTSVDQGLRNGDVAEPLLAQATILGRKSAVTPANHASLMFWVQEGERVILLTGDGHHEAIIASLVEHDLLDGADDARVHVDVLKVPHHGSKNNVDEKFCRHVTADHYVFCGNGGHHNPHLDVVETFVRERVSVLPPPAGEPFHLWFSAHETTANTTSRKKHMKELQTLINDLAGDAGLRGTFEAHFLDKAMQEAGEFPSIEV